MQTNRECPVNIERIRDYFNDPRTVAYYVRAVANIGLWKSEQIVFSRWLGKEDEILDLGCGAGRIALGLWDLGYRNLEGADLSHKMVAESRDIAECMGAKVPFAQQDATQLSYAPEHFNGVIFGFNGLMQIPSRENRRKALLEIHRILAPGGVFIFTTLDREDPLYRTVFSDPNNFDHDVGRNSQLIEQGDRLFRTPHGTTFMHVPRREDVLDDLQSAGWNLCQDAMRSEISNEPASVVAFSEDCRFWVAKKTGVVMGRFLSLKLEIARRTILAA